VAQLRATTYRERLLWTAAILIGLAITAAAQTGAQKSPQTPPATTEPTDPFHRETPRGTFAGFNLAVHQKDFVSAARFMQLSRSQRPNAESLASALTDLIDRYYTAPITAVNDHPEGATNDGLSLDRERVTLTIDEKPVELQLVRVKDAGAGQIWLISSQTLAQVPVLRQQEDASWLERRMPQALLDTSVLGSPIARWIALAATFVIPLAALWLVSAVFIVVAKRTMHEPARRRLLESWYDKLRWPVILVVAIGIHVGLGRLLGFSLRFRMVYSRVALAIGVIIVAWLLWRLLALSMQHTRAMAQRKGQAGVRSLLLLAERVCKTLVVLVTIFVLLTLAGVNTTTALAGVGLGGVAVALGAQKSVENLLGGVLLLTDRALAVGDFCKISDRVGVVEDITMRSVRLRTVDQTLLSVPAGLVSSSSLENFATRDKILMQSTLRLQYGTTASQLRRVLAGIHTLLDASPEIETSSARIRLVDFGVRAIELELFAYVLTPDFLKFLAVREDLLLQIATIVESSGTSFAQPTFVYEPIASLPGS
jgi:MscS family membrane protein